MFRSVIVVSDFHLLQRALAHAPIEDGLSVEEHVVVYVGDHEIYYRLLEIPYRLECDRDPLGRYLSFGKQFDRRRAEWERNNLPQTHDAQRLLVLCPEPTIHACPLQASVSIVSCRGID